MDSSGYSVEIGQFHDFLLKKQKLHIAQHCGIFLLATCPPYSVTWQNLVKIPSAQPNISVARSRSLAYLPEGRLSSTQLSSENSDDLPSLLLPGELNCRPQTSCWKYSKTFCLENCLERKSSSTSRNYSKANPPGNLSQPQLHISCLAIISAGRFDRTLPYSQPDRSLHPTRVFLTYDFNWT